MVGSSVTRGRGRDSGKVAVGLPGLILLAAGGAFAFLHFRKADPPRYATEAEARREALRRYPALGTAGTRLNQSFVERYQLYKKQRPEYFDTTEWPVLLAEETARSLENASAAATASAAGYPDYLHAPFAVLFRSYPRVDAKKFPRSPANSVWLFRSSSGGSGTVEVGFQDAEVVYMVFRRGVGGKPWSDSEIYQLHSAYSHELLHEGGPRGVLYRPALLPQINAAAITRVDFDANSLLSGS